MQTNLRRALYLPFRSLRTVLYTCCTVLYSTCTRQGTPHRIKENTSNSTLCWDLNFLGKKLSSYEAIATTSKDFSTGTNFPEFYNFSLTEFYFTSNRSRVDKFNQVFRWVNWSLKNLDQRVRRQYKRGHGSEKSSHDTPLQLYNISHLTRKNIAS